MAAEPTPRRSSPRRTARQSRGAPPWVSRCPATNSIGTTSEVDPERAASIEDRLAIPRDRAVAEYQKTPELAGQTARLSAPELPLPVRSSERKAPTGGGDPEMEAPRHCPAGGGKQRRRRLATAGLGTSLGGAEDTRAPNRRAETPIGVHTLPAVDTFLVEARNRVRKTTLEHRDAEWISPAEIRKAGIRARIARHAQVDKDAYIGSDAVVGRLAHVGPGCSVEEAAVGDRASRNAGVRVVEREQSSAQEPESMCGPRSATTPSSAGKRRPGTTALVASGSYLADRPHVTQNAYIRRGAANRRGQPPCTAHELSLRRKPDRRVPAP